MADSAGIREATAAMYTTHGHVVLRRAQQILKNAQEAEDVLQEIFASLLQNPSSFEARSRATTFLYAMTTNRCLNRLRDRTTRKRLLERERRSDVVPARSENWTEMTEMLGRLPHDLAEVVVYYYLDEMTQDEIADQIGCSRRQVGHLLDRAVALWKSEEVRACPP
jgi:RNA polymerase sigma-70 factor (ECF subfamily)